MKQPNEILRLALPQTLMMIAYFFVGFVDVLVAAHLGDTVQAALGLITQSFFFFLIIAIALANGVVAAVSQSLGARLTRRAERYTVFVTALALVSGLALAGMGYLFRDVFLDVLQTPEGVRPVARYLLGVYLLVLPANAVLAVTNAVFRAAKRVYVPLVALTLVSVANTLGDLGLGLGWWGAPALGYKGLAWATFGSVALGTLFNLVMLARSGMLRAHRFPPLRWIRPAWGYLFKVSWPAGVSQTLWQSGYLVLYAITASLPVGSVDALAGMTAGMRVESALFLPAFAFNMTASILVGHYLGAGDPAGAKRVGYQVLGLGCGVITVLGALLFLWLEPIANLVAATPATAVQTQGYLVYNLLAIPFTTATMILMGILSGAGATLYSLFIFGVATWLVRLPLAYVLGHVVWMESDGVWVAMLASQVVQAFSGLYIFHYKNWSRFAMRGKRKAQKLHPAPLRSA